MKLKNIFFTLYCVVILYCYNVFAFEERNNSFIELSFNDKIIIIVLFSLSFILVKGFKVKKSIQE